MDDKNLNKYQGRLDAGQIAEGINVSRRNAARLVADERLLLENGRYASATALAILAIEESGKVSILRGMATARDDGDIKNGWKAFRSHRKKNAIGGFLDHFLRGARQLQDFFPLFEDDAEHTYLFENVKQISLYTDCLGKAHWSEPVEVVEEDLARGIVMTAQILTRDQASTEEEISLWIEYMGPHIWHGRERAETALLAFYAEMERRGLRESGGLDVVEFTKRTNR